MNPDLAKERHTRLDLEELKQYLGEWHFGSKAEYDHVLHLREKLLKRISPLYEENFYNLTRDEKYQIVLKKSLELCDFAKENNYDLLRIQNGKLLGYKKIETKKFFYI